MANYSKTQELFNREPNKIPGLKHEKSGEQISEEKWFAQYLNTIFPIRLWGKSRLISSMPQVGPRLTLACGFIHLLSLLRP